MKKREFLKTTGILALGSLAAPFLLESCKTVAPISTPTPVKEEPPIKAEEKGRASAAAAVYEVPALEYAFNALEPHIDAKTMEIHHDKHHAAYTKNLNKALEGHEWATKDLTEIFGLLQNREKDNAIRNHGGGHYNHSLFWRTIGPNAGGSPQGKLAEAINAAFGSFDNFKTKFIDSAAVVFGSGWTWLSIGADKKLFISNTSNQDNPLMKNIVANVGTPILGLDVWEHAYYLKYENRRKEYLTAFFNVVRWDRVAEAFEKELK